jgi:predicted nuclease of predicted toxin-antitoxin system
VRVLLDECIDWRLGRELASHEVKSARQMGWTTLKNGELLALASTQFDVFVTADRNLSFQQDIVYLFHSRRCPSGENQPTR